MSNISSAVRIDSTTANTDIADNTTFDTTARIGRAQVQYGPMNDRIYVMRWNGADPDDVLPRLHGLAQSENLGKIIAKVPDSVAPHLANAGYRREARIPMYYDGEAAVFMGSYPDRLRSNPTNRKKLDHVLELAGTKADDEPPVSTRSKVPDGLTVCDITENDAAEVAEIYRVVFDTYPFPIHNPEYILETMHSNVQYFGIRNKDRLIALSSAEMDKTRRGVEMTDFATLPDWRGYGLASVLLEKMEGAMRDIGMKTAYTIARGPSAGINIVFARQGYMYGGRLVNNTNIAGNIESMNVWHKQLD